MKKSILKIFCLLTFIFISQFSFANNNLKNKKGDVKAMKNLFLCSYFSGVKDTFKDFMNNDAKGKKVLFIPTANIDEETKFLVDEAKEV
ncbi:Type 1 glutamine amidotransferase-like domain-containing protein, partial [Fusobacterium polymorphum]